MRESFCDISSSLNSLFSKEVNLIQSQFLNFLTTTCEAKSNHGMKAKGEGMGKELNIGYEDTSINLSLSPFLLYHELSFKELKSFGRVDFTSLLQGGTRNAELYANRGNYESCDTPYPSARSTAVG
ncbi:hypothetical protein M9H77_23815 [Catharanthus roseus]|uniref:Uncharacterized protein n=1 Tax=Catharanthus roseus TaxID=4058 RepID=A0ACC0AVL5_CATRO|nr:hypothetical protein M9H77_23815 [Catharanthus roseus]